MEASKRCRQITTSGASGVFQGFLNGAAAQNITISGPFVFGPTGLNAGSAGITVYAQIGQYIPIVCTSIQPATTNVTGLIA
jgi:hypothetical protein